MDESAQAKDDLVVIRRLMEGARETTSGNSKHLVLWGSLLAAAEAISHASGRGALPVAPGIVWTVAIGLGWGLSMRFSRKEREQAPVNSLVNRILGAIWIGCGLGLTLLGFLGSWTGTIPDAAGSAVGAIIIGSAFFASSFLPHHTMFRILATIWWVLGGIMLIWPQPANHLFMAGGLLLFMALPGLLLQRRSPVSIRISAVA